MTFVGEERTPDLVDECLLLEEKQTWRSIHDSLKGVVAERSPLRHPGHVHAFTEALASGQVSRIVTRFADTEAMDGETRIQHQSRLHRSPRPAGRAERREHGGEKEMPDGLIAVRLDAAALRLRHRRLAAIWRGRRTASTGRRKYREATGGTPR